MPSLASAILYRQVQGSSCSKIKIQCQDFAVMSNIIRGPKKKLKHTNNKKERLDNKEGEPRSPVWSDDVKHDNHRNLQTGNLVQFH